ncbi:hypothetical protein [Subtercola endophyticus]|uniref:hypothetical protein n=1 Tax=Subtercola endophyticus TaxID=2895559 RepID=UPI001E2DF9F2|nr:hypothetical protein [Subtercola endophyticus]UFS60811.1 hypothetical protein LQ955_08780 [Subtercola endophyticus]
MSTAQLILRGWRVYVPVVVVNAAIQAASVAPFATPAPSLLFVALVAASFLGFAASLILVVAQAAATAAHETFRRPSLRLCIAGLVAVTVIAASAVLFTPVVIVTLTLAAIILPSIAAGPTARDSAGFAVFARHPVRAVGLTIVTLVVLVILWIGALLSGFFLTGIPSAALTWLVFGVFAVIVACAFTALNRRD